MGSEKPFKKTIQNIYKKNLEDQGLFFFVQGFTTALPAVTEKQAVMLYLRTFGFSEDDWPLRTAIENYRQMKIDFLKTDYKCRKTM